MTIRHIHSSMPPQRRRRYADFDDDERPGCKILVATDIVARGVDFRAGVDEVVMFEAPPHFSILFIE